jgi:hypothetical protein
VTRVNITSDTLIACISSDWPPPSNTTLDAACLQVDPLPPPPPPDTLLPATDTEDELLVTKQRSMKAGSSQDLPDTPQPQPPAVMRAASSSSLHLPAPPEAPKPEGGSRPVPGLGALSPAASSLDLVGHSVMGTQDLGVIEEVDEARVASSATWNAVP